MSAFFRFFAIASLFLALETAAHAAEMVVDKIVAQVNGEVVTLFELNERVQNYVTQVEKRAYNPADPAVKELRERVLKSMIEDIMLKQEAVRMKVNISDTEVESRIREIREKGGLSEAQFVQQLRLEGMSRKQFAEAIKRDILKKQLLGYMVQRKVVVSEEEIKAYYEAHKSGLRVETGNRIGLIMLNKMDEAKALRQKIASGQITFADAARKYSTGPGAEQGGDLGKVEVKDLAPELRTALQNVKPGEVSEPVMLDGKPVLLTMAAEKGEQAAPAPADGPGLDSVRNEIHDRLYREKLDKQFIEYMDRLRAKSVIKVNL